MVPGAFVFELLLVVATMLLVTTLAVVGPRPVLRALGDARWRVSAVSLPAAVLVAVLVIRWGSRDFVLHLTWQVFGINITPHIFNLEQTIFPTNPVAALQSIQTPELTATFVFVYIYGYAFLLAFPAVAYFALDDRMDHLSTLLLAYALNYGIGLAIYVVFIAYGPRNVDPTQFEGLLYMDFPQTSELTFSVNQALNVFPSLHTSMAMTVFFLAIRSRRQYPLWVPISGTLAVAVALSTMYLGIHWFTDVVAGTLLALLAVYLATTYSTAELLDRGSTALTTTWNRFTALVEAAVDSRPKLK